MNTFHDQSSFNLNLSNRSMQHRAHKDLSLHQRPAGLYDELHIELATTVSLVEFSCFDNSFDILACACNEFVTILQIVIDADSGKFGYEAIHDYINGSKCTAIAFSPNTDFSKPIDKRLCLAVAGDDFSIMFLNQIFNQDDEHAEQECITGHSDYINHMQFEPINGNLLATASDDCTCCVWSFDHQDKKIKLEMKIILSSPGINVKWHKSEPHKLFVAEKKGVIRFYDTNTRLAVMSFDCNRYPLMSGDWCAEDTLILGCVASKNIYFWDSASTSLPIKILKTTSDVLTEFGFYDSKLIAYRGRPNNFLRVMNSQNHQIYISKEFVAGTGLSWNRRLPLLAVGGLKGVHVYKLNTF